MPLDLFLRLRASLAIEGDSDTSTFGIVGNICGSKAPLTLSARMAARRQSASIDGSAALNSLCKDVARISGIEPRLEVKLLVLCSIGCKLWANLGYPAFVQRDNIWSPLGGMDLVVIDDTCGVGR